MSVTFANIRDGNPDLSKAQNVFASAEILTVIYIVSKTVFVY